MTEEHFVEVDEWVNEFFPQDEKDHRAYLVNCVGQHIVDDVETRFKNLEIPSRETDFCPPLCDVFNALVSRIPGSRPIPDFAFHQTLDRPEDNDRFLKSNICLFPSPTERFLIPGQGPLARMHWSWIEFPIEVKVDPRLAPFNFDDDPLYLKETDEGMKGRAQLIKYASEVQLHQHRTSAVTVWIQRNWVQLLLWDRNGAVVSRAMDFTADPIPFMSFLCRYVTASRADRGHDPTVQRATVAQVASLREYASRIEKAAGDETSAEYHQDQHLQRMLRDLEEYPINVLTALDEETDEATKERRARDYLVGPCQVRPRHPAGSACKGYVAYDIDRESLVWIKDYWCVDSEDAWSEVDVYRLLKRHKVRNVPTLIAGGDVGGLKAQRTRSDRYMNDKLKLSLHPRYHQRLILKELCRPLESHRDEHELISCIRDAAIAYQDAYEHAKILHRDISIGNILIDIATNKGLLSDWELAKPLDKLHGRPGPSNMSGTWITMSSLLQMCPYKPYEVTDDLESFLHVTEYMAAQFYEHEYSPRDPVNRKLDVNPILNWQNRYLANFVNRRFLSAIDVGECTVGQPGRVAMMGSGWSTLSLDSTKSPKLASLLDSLYKRFAPLYQPDNIKACEERWGPRADLGADFPEIGCVTNAPTPAALVQVLEDHVAMTAGPAKKLGDQFLRLPTLIPLVSTGPYT